jgi:hypothetical protein
MRAGAAHAMTAGGLIHRESYFLVSLTLITAVILLPVGIAATVSMIFRWDRSIERMRGCDVQAF